MFITSKQEGDKCEQSHQHHTNPRPWVQEGWGAVPSAEAQERGGRRWEIQCPETAHLDLWSLKQGSQPRKTRKTTAPVRLHSSRLGEAWMDSRSTGHKRSHFKTLDLLELRGPEGFIPPLYRLEVVLGGSGELKVTWQGHGKLTPCAVLLTP